MSGAHRRGGCPGLSAPMSTGDGLLVRLRAAAPIPLDAMAGFCKAARRHGNGTIEVSARGSLQVRGLTPESAPLFASAVAELGIASHESVPVIARFDFADGAGVAAELRRAIASAGLALSPKVSVVIDGDGPLHLDALTADVRLRAAEPHQAPRVSEARLHLGLGGDGASAIWLGTVAAAAAAGAVLGSLRIIAARGATARAAEILRTEGVRAFGSAAAVIEPAPMPPRRKPAEMIGLHFALDGTVAVGIGLAFGHTHADAVAEIVRLAAVRGAKAAQPMPDRVLLLLGVSPPDVPDLTAAAEQLGFVVRAGDPRRRIAACPGAPACASGLIPARALASALAPVLECLGTNSRGDRALGIPSPLVGEGRVGGAGDSGTDVPHASTLTRDPSQQGGGEECAAPLLRKRRGIAVHISGCPKGCAHPVPAPLTVVGTPHGCGIVRDGSARAAPGHYIDPAKLSEEILRLAARSGEAAHG